MAYTLLPGASLAAPGPIAGVTPWSQTARTGLEFGGAVNPPSPYASATPPYTLAWVLAGQGAIEPEVVPGIFVGGRFGFSYASFREDGDPMGSVGVDQATYSNFLVSIHLATTVVKDVLAVHAGVRVGLPLLWEAPSFSTSKDGVKGVFPSVVEAAQRASLLDAGWGMDTFHPRVVPIRPGGGLEVGTSNGSGATLGRAELHLPIFASGGGARVSLELAAEGEWRHTSGAGVGLRVQSVFFLTANHPLLTPDDVAQVAIEPFVAFTPERLPFYARFGVLVAANEPLGGDDPAITFRLAAGWKLPNL